VIGVNFLTPAPVPKNDSSSCSGTLWKITLWLLFAVLKPEVNVYFASWSKITVRAILPLPNMDKLRRGFSAGKQFVASCLHWMIISKQVKTPTLTVNPNALSLCVSYCHQGCGAGLGFVRSWRFLGGVGVGFLTTLGVGVEFFYPTPDTQLVHFLHHTSKLGIPVQMIQILLKRLLKQRFIAVYHDFHWF